MYKENLAFCKWFQKECKDDVLEGAKLASFLFEDQNEIVWNDIWDLSEYEGYDVHTKNPYIVYSERVLDFATKGK